MATTTLTWRNSGLGAKTGTAIANIINDLVTLVNSKSSDANFNWQVASSSNVSPNFYVTLKRKDGSPGRILLITWNVSPGGLNPSLLEQAPSTISFYGAFFPNGNTDTPLNLAAASGAVFGNDTDTTKAVCIGSNANIYAASYQPFYFDTAEAIFIAFQNPAGATGYGGCFGYCIVDANDNAYSSAWATGGTAFTSWGTGLTVWSASSTNAPGTTTGTIRISSGGVGKTYYHGMAPNGAWTLSAVGATDILTDTATNRVWFVPVSVLGLTKGEGFIYKHRQMGYGPGTVGPFTTYNTTGPVVQAIQMNAATVGGNGLPWLLNFKI